jgi:CheY-like chemotaxis protein
MKIILIATLAFLCGVAAFILLLTLVKGRLAAYKRKKTKLGLVKVAGAGLKFSDDDEPEGSGGRPGVAGVGAAVNTKSDGASVGAGVDTGIGNKDAVRGVDTAAGAGVEAGAAEEDVAADAPAAGADSDAADVSDEDAGHQDEDVLDDVPLDAMEEEDIPGPLAVGSVGPVRKIVELPVENPFIGGKLAVGDHKKTSAPQRRRLPETVKMKDRKVILAEDVAINRDLIAMYFDGSGVKFEFAVNGREVCEKFERDPGAYSLILMDIQMPEMDGYEVSRRIRSMDVDWAKQIPIIAMTGNDQKEDIDLCFEAGMDDHIPKPIDMEVLQEKVFDIITLNAESF